MTGWLLKLAAGNPIALLWIVGGVFVAGLAAGGSVAWTVQGWRLDAAKSEIKVVQGRFDAFVSQAKALGEQQAEKAKAEDIVNQQRKAQTDEENERRRAADASIIASLRAKSANPHSRPLPPAASTSSRPDLLCLDRTEYQRENGDALARLFEGVRSLADEGSAATLDLNSAKKWAQKLSYTMDSPK